MDTQSQSRGHAVLSRHTVALPCSATMFIIPRYLLRQFLQIFVICFVSLIGLYIVIDLFGHLDHFSSYAEKEGNLLGVIARYYAFHSLAFFDGVSGLLAMISAMFTVAWLARHQEMTALLAAGVSKFRIIKPLLIAAAAVSLIGVLNRELVIPIPQVRDELVRDTKDLGGGAARELEARFDADSNILLGGDSVILSEKRIINPSFVLMGPELARFGKHLSGANAHYVEANPYHPAGFVLTEVTAPKTPAALASHFVEDRPIIITPRDASSWLAPNELFVASQMQFPVLAAGSKWRTYASLPELIRELKSPSANSGADVRVAIHTRIVQFFMDGTLVMLGLPVILSRRSRNAYVAIGICLGVAMLFMLTALACQSLGSVNMLRPTLAAWGPLLVFVPIATALSQSLRT
jgi:lipopolysaccharide export system permease protein